MRAKVRKPPHGWRCAHFGPLHPAGCQHGQGTVHMVTLFALVHSVCHATNSSDVSGRQLYAERQRTNIPSWFRLSSPKRGCSLVAQLATASPPPLVQ